MNTLVLLRCTSPLSARVYGRGEITYSSLQLWNIRDVATHTCGSNEATVAVVLHLVSCQVRASLLLSAEHLASCLCAIEDTVQIRRHHFVVV